jgi:hypothetical protein
VDEIEEITAAPPILAGHHGYPGLYGYSKHYGFPSVVETDVIKTFISSDYCPKHFGYSTLVTES